MDNNEEINKWMIERDLEAYRLDAERIRLAEYRRLDGEEARLRAEIQKQTDLYETAQAEEDLARRRLEDAQTEYTSAARHAELVRFELSDLGGQLDR